MSAELNTAEEWLVSELQGSPSLMALVAGVHTGSVPAQDHASDYPCVLIQYVRGSDFKMLGRKRLMVDAIYAVRGIALERASEELAEISDEIDAVLDRQGEAGVRCWREEPYRNEEVDSGVKYLHDGGLYHVQIQSS
jgi:hypothetical protein